MFEQLLKAGGPRQLDAGQVWGRLTLTSDQLRNPLTGRLQRWCQCSCGKQVWIAETSIKNGNTRSCGCLRVDMITERIVKAAKNNKRGVDGRYLPKDNGVTNNERTQS